MTQVNVTTHDNIVAGSLLFLPNVTADNLVDTIKQLRDDVHGHNFIELYVRSNGKKSHCICFQYRFGAGKKDFESFSYRIRDKMSRRFGADFKGWDFSSAVRKIDGLPFDDSDVATLLHARDALRRVAGIEGPIEDVDKGFQSDASRIEGNLSKMFSKHNIPETYQSFGPGIF